MHDLDTTSILTQGACEMTNGLIIINDVFNLLIPGQSAIAVFTKGLNLHLRKSGVSKSGIWKVDKFRRVDKIIVYFRHDNVNEIIIGDHYDTIPSNVRSRFYLRFQNYRTAGFTSSNWKEFAVTGSHPVRYIR